MTMGFEKYEDVLSFLVPYNKKYKNELVVYYRF